MNWIQKSLKTKTGKTAAIGFAISTAVLGLEFTRDMSKTFSLTELQQERLELTLGFLSKVLTGSAIVAHGGAGMMRVASKKGLAIDENNDGIPDHLQKIELSQTVFDVKIDRLAEKIDAIAPNTPTIEDAKRDTLASIAKPNNEGFSIKL